MSIWLLETCKELEQTNIRKRSVRQVGYLQRKWFSAECFNKTLITNKKHGLFTDTITAGYVYVDRFIYNT